jgi:hypothetical protein
MQSTDREDVVETQSSLGRLFGHLRQDGLRLVSAIGTALTVLSSLQDTLTVATWAKALVGGFFAYSAAFWAGALPFLDTPPRPMDVVFLNLGAFLALIALASLAPRDQIRWHWREATWAAEGMALVGMAIAIGLIMWSGVAVIEAAYSKETFPAMQAAMASATSEVDREAVAIAAMTGLSAFFPIADSLHAALGFERGSLFERIDEVALVLMALHAAIILAPSVIVLVGGAAFGYFNDNARTARWVWLFLAIVAAVLLLSTLAEFLGSVCNDPGTSPIVVVCRLV